MRKIKPDESYRLVAENIIMKSLNLGILFEFIGFYNNNHDVTLKQRKREFYLLLLVM